MKHSLLAALAITLAACGGKSGHGPRQRTIGMSQCNLGEPWRIQMNADIKAAAEKHADLKIVFKDAQNDTLKQRAHVEEFASAGVDALIISPKESQPLTEPVAKAYRRLSRCDRGVGAERDLRSRYEVARAGRA